MNRSAIKTFAVWARQHLRQQVTARLKYFGITAQAIEEPTLVSGGLLVAGQTLDAEDASAYQQLRDHLQELAGGEAEKLKGTKALKAAVASLIDEVAYTWFNRFSALRYMEVNGYLRRRVLSSSDELLVDPDILRMASDVAAAEELPGLTLTVLDEWRILAAKSANAEEFLYRRLVNAQCLALAEGLPFLFEESAQYTALFMPGNLLNSGSIVRRLVEDIPEEDWRDAADSENGVEIIGWLYQFYISERKDEVIGAKGKIAARDIPAATQLFTPHWIVRYMVENSLGRLWVEGHPESKLREKMPYYLESPPPEGTEEKAEREEQLELSNSVAAPGELSVVEAQDLTVMDPACGSGHILVYAFDLLFEIYKEQGYAERDIPALILEHNLHGLDIDERAVQLASFSVLMKARAKNSRILRRSPKLNIATVRSTQNLSLPAGKEFVESDWQPLLEAFKEADSLGSLITPPALDEAKLLAQVDAFESDNPVFRAEPKSFRDLVEQAQLLRQQYLVVVANPPYMSNKGLNSTLKKDLAQNYRDFKTNLFSAFIIRSFSLSISETSMLSFVTPFSWMFLSSFEKLRELLLHKKTIVNLVKPSYTSFFESAIVSLVTFTVKNSPSRTSGVYIDLGYLGSAESQSPKLLKAIEDPKCGYYYHVDASDFSKMPGSPIAYWLSKSIIEIFATSPQLVEIATPRLGMATGNNDRFLRFWYEVHNNRIGLHFSDREEALESKKKWFPYNKGGDFRRWYGNNEYLVDWEKDGYLLQTTRHPSGRIWAHNFNLEYIFRESLTWTTTSSSYFAIRYSPKGHLFDNKGSSIFSESTNTRRILGVLSSSLCQYFMKALNSSVEFQPGNVASMPMMLTKDQELIEREVGLVENCIVLSRKDWDSFEASWDFQTHPLFIKGTSHLKQAFAQWKNQSETTFQQLKQLEEENNRYWINAYSLQDELTPEVPDDQITIRRADLSRDIRSFISYAIGCTMGRYSLDAPGLIHAGQPFDTTRHTTFPADPDAIIPITDQAYFTDDIVTRFIEFVKVTYGEATLIENLDFIANALKLRASETAQDRIRRYFVTEFISDHIKTYKKRPIYWLFTSGKAGSRRSPAFSALVYLHRYSEDTVARIRTDYVLELQVKLDEEIKRVDADVDTATTTTAKKTATKRLQILKDQQLELRDYQAKLQTIADQRIQLDLDDGVAYNYTLFEGLLYEGSDLKMADLKKKSQWKRDLLSKQDS